MSEDSDSELQNELALKKLIPQGRQLLPNQFLLSIPPQFISYSKAVFTQNHRIKYEPLGQYNNIKIQKQNDINLIEMFQIPIYKRYKQLQIFENTDLNFNFVRFPLESKYKKIENQRALQQNYSNQIIFDSQFQSGNLASVQKISNNQYNLLLQNDINTFGYNQWFFFKVKNNTKIKVKFNIINMYKKKSLYEQGMKLVIFSLENFRKGCGWERGGENISYFPNNIKFGEKKFHTLTWTYHFNYDYDQVYFAFHYPYTFSDLNNYLDSLEKMNMIYFKRAILCTTISNNRVDYLTITEPKFHSQKKYIMISARVHPGETVSSFMMKGIIDYLISPEAITLRQKYIFRLIPMLNPDGVINGNYRCSLSGRDLNRRWQKPKKYLYPEIYYLKKMILKLSKENKLELFCDLHGHSAKKGIFFYGCEHHENPYIPKELPFIMSKLSNNVSFKNCNFKTSKTKRGTARVALYNATNIPKIYTIENSFCGPTDINYHFTPRDYQMEGKTLCKAIDILYNVRNKNKNIKFEKNKINKIIQSQNLNKIKSQKLKKAKQQYLQKKINERIDYHENFQQSEIDILHQLYQSNQLSKTGEIQTSGSQSQPSIDEVEAKYIMIKFKDEDNKVQKKQKKNSIHRSKEHKQQIESLPQIKSQINTKNKIFSFDFKQRKQLKDLRQFKQHKQHKELKEMKDLKKKFETIKQIDYLQPKIKRNFTSQKIPQIANIKFTLINQKKIKKFIQSPEMYVRQQVDMTRDLINKTPSEINITEQNRIQENIKKNIQNRKGKLSQNYQSTIIVRKNSIQKLGQKIPTNKLFEMKIPYNINLKFEQKNGSRFSSTEKNMKQ